MSNDVLRMTMLGGAGAFAHLAQYQPMTVADHQVKDPHVLRGPHLAPWVTSALGKLLGRRDAKALGAYGKRDQDRTVSSFP